MFGFVKIYKPELKIKDYEIYRGVYCSLCKELGNSYGLFSRFVLNYDFTFLALLKLALSADCQKFKASTCSFNPFKKCLACSKNTSALQESAAGAVIISYFKLSDNVSDEGFFKKNISRLCKLFLHHAYKKASSQFPKLNGCVEDMMRKQIALEKQNCKSIDMAADPTATAMQFIFGELPGNSASLRRLGYCLGKYIYTIDAVVDLEDDIKHGKYNPLKCENMTDNQIEKIKDESVGLLNYCISEAINAYKELNVFRFNDILENILYDGLYFSMNDLLLSGGKKNGKSL